MSAVRTPGSPYFYNRNGFLTRVSANDKAEHKVVLWSLQASLLQAYHYIHLVGHLEERTMHNTIQRRLYWPEMHKNAYTTVTTCREGARWQVNKTRMGHLKFFSFCSWLNSIVMEIRSLLLSTRNGNEFWVIKTSRYSRLPWALLTSIANANHIASICLGHWIKRCSTPAYLLTSNVTQLVSKLLETICYFLWLKKVTTITFYH